jgi:hypothetical protein
MKGYNSNGRPIYKIKQNGPWNSDSYTINPPNGNVRSGLDPFDVLSQLQTEGIRPKIEGDMCGNAKRFFKSNISHMPLPEGV